LAFTNGALILNGYYYAYAYGNSWVNYVGRVPLAGLTDKSAWTYYAGNGNWASDVSQAVSVFGGGTGNDVFYDAYLGQYVTMYVAYDSNQVYVRVANVPEGPWSSPRLVATVPLRYGQDYAYIAHIHPELSDHGRTVEFTYTISPGTNRQVLPVWSVKFNKPNRLVRRLLLCKTTRGSRRPAACPLRVIKTHMEQLGEEMCTDSRRVFPTAHPSRYLTRRRCHCLRCLRRPARSRILSVSHQSCCWQKKTDRDDLDRGTATANPDPGGQSSRQAYSTCHVVLHDGAHNAADRRHGT
jgi:hypothetical protein